MKQDELIQVLNDLNDIILTTPLLVDNKKAKYSREIKGLISEFRALKIPDNFKPVFTSLVEKGKELKGEFKVNTNTKELSGTIEYYIGYLKAAMGDFTGKTPYISKYTRMFLATSILFMALSPQYFGFILPLIFFVPIFLGMKGLRNRSKNGFRLSLTVVPVALMVAFTWIRYGLYAMQNFGKAVADATAATGQSPAVAKLFVIIPPVFAVLLVVCAVLQAYRGYKSKDLYV